MSAINSKFGARAGVNLASSLVVLMGALAGERVFAQDATDAKPEIEEVVVQGTRASLENAQDIKRDADTFVDAISASDIGALPDRSVLEAMQRIPGISIERFAGSNDPDHFGVEGSGAVVRGMTQTRSEFNGRDSFTANSGRGLSFQDVPPELMKTVSVFKNQTADMVEGGIAGTVNLVTRKPFDASDMQLSFSADVTYGDMVEEVTPTLSGLFSNRFDTEFGEFGILLNATDSNLEASSHGIQTDKYELRGLSDVVIDADKTIPGLDVSDPYIYDGSFGRGLVDRKPRTNPDGSQLFCVDPSAAGAPAGCVNQGALVPNGSNLTMKDDVRDRTGLAAALQWQNPDDTLLVSAQFLRSDSSLAWTERALKNQSDYNSATQWYQPYKGAEHPEFEYGFGEDGTFTHGLITNIADGWRGGGEKASSSAQYFGTRYTADTRHQVQTSVVEDTALNVVWTPSDKFELETDVQYIDAETTNDDYLLMYGTYMNQMYDIRGDMPSLTIYNPWSLVPESSTTALQNKDWWVDPVDGSYFSQPSSYANYAASDHIERSNGKSLAARIDATYFIDDSYFTKIKVGARRAERDQIVRNSTYNWGALQPFWQSDGGWLDGAEYPATVADIYGNTFARTEAVDWSNFHRGGVARFTGPEQISLHPSIDLVKAYSSWQYIFWDEIKNDCGDWRPLAGRVDEDAFDANDICQNVLRSDLNGAFLDGEITDSSEINSSFYTRVDFEIDTAMRIAGNFGVRVVSIESESAGHTRYPDLRPGRRAPTDFNPYTFNPFDTALYPNPATDLPYDLYDDSSKFLGDVNNFIPQEWKDFANGVTTEDFASQRYTKTLPSFNIKVELTPELIGRFAVSKAIALPDIGDMRNYTNIGTSLLQNSVLPNVFTADNPHPDAPPGSTTGNPEGSDGKPLKQQSIIDKDSITLGAWTADSGNPFLRPMESTQWDISLEWYFGRSNSITGSIFYKDLNNFFFNGVVNREFTNPTTGVKETVATKAKMNGGEGEMAGFEINYQQYYDMLPSPWDGLGTQMNYSYIDAAGVPNPGVSDPGVEFEPGTSGANATNSEEIGLEGQSKHTANLILMYQKSGFDARIAYNWRSEYLITSLDVISKMPVYNDDSGFLDASIFYNITDQIKIGLQGVNLLNTVTKTYQLIDDEHKLGRSWFVNDRRYSLVVRATF